MRWLWLIGFFGIAMIFATTQLWMQKEQETREDVAALSRLAPAAGSRQASPIGGDFTLTDQNGNLVTSEQLKGQYALVTFGFTFCPDICPTTLNTITAALERMGKGGETVRPVFVSVDPERDTPERLKTYAANFHPRLLALTGTPSQLRQITDAYKVYYRSQRKNPQDTEYSVDHSSFIYLMNPEGDYVTHFPYDISDEALAVRLNEVLSGADPY